MREFTVECTYDPCNCTVIAPVASGEAYCSDFCNEATEQSLESPTCACGHPPCDEP